MGLTWKTLHKIVSGGRAEGLETTTGERESISTRHVRELRAENPAKNIIRLRRRCQQTYLPFSHCGFCAPETYKRRCAARHVGVSNLMPKIHTADAA